ncbi:MAG: hypothetical protein GXY13_08575 [Acidimicrobiales bacterium]|nr:hypothetical protein [Acidimicrobiales bacterium]
MTGTGSDFWGDLAGRLQVERDLLERLRFRYVALDLMVEAGEARFLGWALRDLDRARLKVREVDLARAADVARLNLKGARGVPSLREVAAVAPRPWSTILRDHHDDLSAVVTEIEVTAHRIAQHGRDGLAELARTGTVGPRRPEPVLAAADAALVTGGGAAVMAPEVARLRAPGTADAIEPVAIECLLHDVIAAAGRLRIPALLAFLR